MNNTAYAIKARSPQWLGLSGLLVALMFTLPACASKPVANPAQQNIAHEAGQEAVHENQADVMKVCQVNATAMNLEGDTREYYLNGCLLAPVRTHAAHKQCQVNATAMNLDGETRRHYLLSCLARQ